MLKRDELADPNSCLNKAADDEPLFVLRAKDVAGIATILDWIERRILYGVNEYGDEKIQTAFHSMRQFNDWRKKQIQIETPQRKTKAKLSRRTDAPDSSKSKPKAEPISPRKK